ncbi:MAG: PAS domain S-box protein [Nitrospirae bacterium]|nr:PAS domain S-box protein [Nitrospirota bacterium]MCL5978004.1 PAS domain S-box protein [Nitrospirota bacterium]
MTTKADIENPPLKETVGAKILIVDDDETVLRFLSALLSSQRYVLETAQNGIEAIEKTKKNNPDIVLLDVLMPEMNGIEACKRLKEDHETQHIPIIVLTAFEDKEMKIECLNAGANDFLSKPVDNTELIARIKNFLQLKNLEDVKRKNEALLEAQEKIIHLKQLYSTLSGINEAIIHINDPMKLFEQACRIAGEDGMFRMAWIGLIDKDTHMVKPVVSWSAVEDYLDGITISIDDVPEGQGPTGRAVRQGSHVICNDIEHDEYMKPWRDKAIQHGYYSSASFPLRLGATIIGAFNLYAGEPNFFTTEHILLLEKLSENISFAIELIEKEKQRKHAEKALQESEKRFRLLTESTLTGIYLIQDNLFRYVNQAIASTFGYKVEELIDKLGPMDLTAPENRDLVAGNIRRRIEGEVQDIRYSFRGLRKDGTLIDVEVHGARVEYNGKPAVIGTLLDITERKKAEEVRAFLANITEHATDAIEGLDLDTNIVSWNRGAETLFGYTAQEIIGRSHSLIVPKEAQEACHGRFKKATMEGFVRAETERVKKDGRRFPVEMTLTALKDEGDEHTGFVCITRDITERKRAEESLRKSEERYKRLLESVTNYIYTVEIKDGKPVPTKHGPGCVAVTGYTSEEYEADPHLWYQMVYEGDREVVIAQANKVLSGEAVKPLEHRIIHKDGSIRWVRNAPVPRYDEHGRVVAYDGLITEITGSKKLEEQLRHAQKMEAIGQLAGGIAHDFNNMLNAIIGFGGLMQMDMKEDDPNRAHLKEILNAGERAAHLTKSLLAFSRKQIIEPKPQDLNEIIKGVEKFLSRIIGEDIELKTALSDKGLTVFVDSGQIEQVLMNLATNARDAMPDGGDLIIETGPVQIDEEYIKRHGYGDHGMYALLSVTDSGIGMDEKTRERIFEPFFTTKELGRGTGLGLSMVYGIVKQHDGFINVYSEPGNGMTFKIYLPLIESEAREAVSTAPAVYPERGTETVLVAEDDQAVRNLTRDVLERFGYKVIAAEDGEEAIEKFMDNKKDIQLLLLDVLMPKKNGKEVYEEIKKINPGIKTIFLSGYTANLIHKKGILEEGLDFILKPVSPKELLGKVREILDRGRNKEG